MSDQFSILLLWPLTFSIRKTLLSSLHANPDDINIAYDVAGIGARSSGSSTLKNFSIFNTPAGKLIFSTWRAWQEPSSCPPLSLSSTQKFCRSRADSGIARDIPRFSLAFDSSLGVIRVELWSEICISLFPVIPSLRAIASMLSETISSSFFLSLLSLYIRRFVSWRTHVSNTGRASSS